MEGAASSAQDRRAQQLPVQREALLVGVLAEADQRVRREVVAHDQPTGVEQVPAAPSVTPTPAPAVSTSDVGGAAEKAGGPGEEELEE